ncbi:putative ABC transport system permease protein [Luteibacter sp. OK325]|uniref:ABC transporter permease n=1 Tax=Luteibacter sp. OK325 TaxID=2135670 RepID=UPI000D3B3576|nr:FtsX-like permease family protein [Luteibacter sp. OK325]PTR25493.1 putative ABC transport system permease protein [Luteibacter sp. OK325]
MPPFRPILAALRYHKSGALLIALQVALTLAVVCNALFVIEHRLQRLSRDTGVAESELMVVNNKWVAPAAELPARQAADVAMLRALPGVADAYATNAFPLMGGAWQSGVRLDPTSQHYVSEGASIYFVDDHALNTLGVKVTEGRNFRSDEIGALVPNGSPDTPSIIITRALARRAFPDGHALGKAFYIGNRDARPSTIVGIVEHVQTPQTDSSDDIYWNDSIFVPMRLTGSGAFFVIRAQPGRLPALLHNVPDALKALSTRRVIPAPHGVLAFSEVRDMAYRSDRGLAWMLAGICVTLLVVTAAGIVGLTSFWVGQRRRQIGIRRALGATRRDILVYFLTENGLISLAGGLAGVVLAFALNAWMMKAFETSRLSLLYVGGGMLILLLLGQLAVLSPARRASRVPPVEATRTI